jgi:hypothetical protein
VLPVGFWAMTIDTTPARSRRLPRTAAVTFGLALGSLAAPAFAAPPDAWGEPDNGSMLDNLLYLVGVPVLVFLVIALLVYLPSMMRRQSSEPALAFRDRPEWFGGPRKGVGGAPASGPDHAGDADAPNTSGKGGASARW